MPEGVCQPIVLQNFARNCMKMKEFGPKGWGAHPLDPLLMMMTTIITCIIQKQTTKCIEGSKKGGALGMYASSLSNTFHSQKVFGQNLAK